ncbi:tocopherol cyclase family protein [Clostridium oryzae]|uniref:Tocopherol cyclase n=1 Tax=Clostridium oryzae TaxID=1450648 RepID=A0A1V4ISQ9_9CLOT|nr:tocopherol cyclase family protein [Clostridium oryzae]OPJ62850.1 hypothetical protein CLORY_14740 [Clostridium oryzae]
MLKSTINPNIYHGNNHKSNFFEGWYFKIEHPTRNLTYCFIPGIFMEGNKVQHHSFIQIINGHDINFKYIKFHKEDFIACKDRFEISIGENMFSLNRISLNINRDGEKIKGKLNFSHIIEWPDTILNPGSMGFYNYLTFMQCYTQVCAMDGMVEGSLNINGENVDFTGGKVYIEKNWGSAFPYSYIWAQGNCFTGREVSITCSIGHIPFFVTSFTGFLIGIYVKGTFYKFTTINRSKLSIGYEKDKLILQSHNREYSIEIDASYNKGDFVNLFAPRDERMIPIAAETLQGKINLTIYDERKKQIIFEDSCINAGVEFCGKYRILAEL